MIGAARLSRDFTMRMFSRMALGRLVLCGLLVVFAAGVVVVAMPQQALAQDGKGGETGEKREKPGWFEHMWDSLTGSFMAILITVVLLSLSIMLFTLIVLLSMDLRMGNSIPPA